MEALLILLGGIVIIPALIMYSSMSWGYVMTKLWIWFLLPVFPNMPHITFWQAVGLIIFLQLFKNYDSNGSIKDEYKDKISMWIQALLAPWLILFCGWLVLQFM
jgi:hypothetical protein